MKRYVFTMVLLGSMLLQAESTYDPYDKIVKECKENVMHGCNELGKHFLLREEGNKALRYFNRACDNGYYKSCIELGNMYAYGKGRKRNSAKAAKYYKRVCDRGEGTGCTMLGTLMMNSGIGSNEKAFSYFEKACKLGDGEGCSKLAHHTKEGNRGRKKNKTFVLNTYKKACKKTISECLILGDAYAKGELGVAINYKQAKQYYEKACSGNSTIACYRLGNLYYKGKGVKKSYKKAKSYYEKACYSNYLNGTERGCNNLAVLYHYGRGVKKDLHIVKKYYKRACEKGYSKACETLKSFTGF